MRICISLTFEDIENLKKGKEVETILENHNYDNLQSVVMMNEAVFNKKYMKGDKND